MTFEIYTYISLGIFTIFLLILTVIFYLKLQKATKNLSELTQNSYDYQKKLTDSEINFTILNAKYTDKLHQITDLESSKQLLSEKITQLEKEISAKSAEISAKEQSFNTRIEELNNIKESLTLKFKDISNEIILKQHETFTLSQKNTLNTILTPFNEELKNFKQEVEQANKERIKDKATFDVQFNSLLNLNQNLQKEAQNLTEALKGSKKAQGNWGEYQLDRILEISGLRKDIDYTNQATYQSEEKRQFRPDVIVHLPENRDIIIDSKVSLNDYLDALNTDDIETKQKSLQKNLSAIKAHIDELAAKEYQKLLKDKTLNYVIMFIPIESAYIEALQRDNNLYDYAYKKNVILTTPLSLLPILRTIENLWRIDAQNQNASKIAELGGKIYDKLAAFVEDLTAIDRGLNQAKRAYDNAVTKFQGRGGALSQAEKLKALGAKTNKTVNLPLNDNELLLLEDDTELGEQNA